MDYLAAALILIVVGVALLAAEILLPTGGFLVVAALLFFAAGVGTILMYGDALEAAVAVGGLAVGLPAAGFVAVSAWRRLSLGNTLEAGAGATALDIPQLAGLDALKGHYGKTVSPLRPSGLADFEGRRVDAQTEGMMLDAGVWVRCVDVKGGRVIVRQMETPQDIADIDPEHPDTKPFTDSDLDNL